MFYASIRALASRALTWFYSRVDTEGLERIPSDTPVLLAVNHPNAMVDSLVVAWAVPRRLVLTARATLFTNPLLAAFLRFVGVVPLIRQKDVAELGAAKDVDRNARAFAMLNSALQRGRAVLIFPEGVTGDWVSLARLRTGAARIALQARDAGVRALSIVPIGLTFERKDEPRTRVFAQVGEPIWIDKWPRVNAEEDARALTEELDRRLRAVTLNFESEDAASRDRALAAQLARLFRGTQATPQVWQRYAPLGDQVAIARRIEDARSRLGSASPLIRDRAEQHLDRLTHFRDTLSKRGLVIEDLEIDLGVRLGAWFVIRETLVALIAAPFALWGWINHWLPFQVAGSIAVFKVESAADPATNTIVAGIAAVLASYAVQFALVWALFGGWIALAYVVSLPIAADVNFHLAARLQRVIQRSRAYLRLRKDASLTTKLRRELEELRAEALAVESALTK